MLAQDTGDGGHVVGQVQRVDGADNSTADARVGEQQLEAGLHRVDARGQADMPARQGLFTRMALPCSAA